jgi:hypothetical protein
VINANGGAPRQLTSGSANNTRPSRSGDGRWIYFASNRSGDSQVWKALAQGGEPVQLTKAGGDEAFESVDGKLVFYSKPGKSGIWSIPVDGGEEAQVLGDAREGGWAATRDGICFVDSKDELHAVIRFYNFLRRRSIALYEFPRGTYCHGIAVSPDEHWISYAQVDQEGSNPGIELLVVARPEVHLGRQP